MNHWGFPYQSPISDGKFVQRGWGVGWSTCHHFLHGSFASNLQIDFARGIEQCTGISTGTINTWRHRRLTEVATLLKVGSRFSTNLQFELCPEKEGLSLSENPPSFGGASRCLVRHEVHHCSTSEAVHLHLKLESSSHLESHLPVKRCQNVMLLK